MLKYHSMKPLLCILLTTLGVSAAEARVHSLQVRILSTMLTADEGYGEWGWDGTGGRISGVVNHSVQFYFYNIGFVR